MHAPDAGSWDGEHDLLATDLRVCMFTAALRSVKRHFSLKHPVMLPRKDSELDDEYYERLVCNLWLLKFSCIIVSQAACMQRRLLRLRTCRPSLRPDHNSIP